MKNRANHNIFTKNKYYQHQKKKTTKQNRDFGQREVWKWWLLWMLHAEDPEGHLVAVGRRYKEK